MHVANRSLRPGLGRFFGLLNPGIWQKIRAADFDAVVWLPAPATSTPHSGSQYWQQRQKTATLFGTDAHHIAPRDGRRWKIQIKKWLWPRLYRLADVVIVPSTGGVNLMHSLGIPPERVVLTPYSVDNQWWIEQGAQVNRSAVRAEWGISDDATVVLFCAKLQPWKRPHDLLRAFAKADVKGAYLVFAGDGSLRASLETEAQSLNVADRVRF